MHMGYIKNRALCFIFIIDSLNSYFPRLSELNFLLISNTFLISSQNTKLKLTDINLLLEKLSQTKTCFRHFACDDPQAIS